MNDKNIICFADLNEESKKEAVRIFVDGFGHMLTFAKTKEELLQLYDKAFDEELVYVCMANNRVGGIVGLGTNTKRATKVDKQLCEELFGKGKGKIAYNILRKTEEKIMVKKDTDIYVDFLATSPQMRKQGIATKLLTFVCEMPEYTEVYLDVLSKNISAARLYESLGFAIYKKSFNIFTFIQGLGQPVLMRKQVQK